MKNLKKILAVVLAVAMLASMTVTALAAAPVNEAKAESLKALDLFKGGSNGFDLEGDLPRIQAAILTIRANGVKDEEVNAMTQEEMDAEFEKIEDEALIADWAKPFAAYALKAGYVNGVSREGKVYFDADAPITGTLFVTLLLRSMGYDPDYTNPWATATDAGLASAVSLGLKASLIRDDAVGVLYEMVDVGVNADGTSFLQFLIDSGAVTEEQAIEAGFMDAEPEELEILDVSADNLVEVVVEFNKALDKESAEKSDNYTLNGGKTVTKAVLQDDESTVILTVGELENQAEYTLTVRNVKAADGAEIAKTQVEFIPFDAYLPEIESIEFTGPKSFEVKVSEPLETEGTVTVKSSNSTLSVKSKKISPSDKRVIKVELYTELKDGKEYTISISGYTDYAGYQNISYKESHVYNKSTDLPVATIESANQKVVEVKFSKPVTGLTKDHFYHTFTAWTAIEIYEDEDLTNTVEPTESVSTVYVQFATTGDDQNPLPAGTVEFHIKAKANDKEIKDAWGNKFESATFKIEISADKTPPSVVDVEIKSGTEVKITFDEKIGNLKEAKYTLYDEDGKKVNTTISKSPSSDSKSVTLTFGADQSGKTRNLKIEDIVDDTLYKNEMDSYTATLDFGDTEFKGIDRVEYDSNAKVLYVIYKEDVEDSALELGNYKVKTSGGAIKSLEGPAAFFEGTKVVKIELSDDEDAFVDTSAKLLVANVKDLAGNGIVGFQLEEQIEAIGNVKATITAVNATGTKEIQVQFDQELVEVDISEFTVSGGNTVTGIDTELNDDGTLVTLTLQNAMPYDAAGVKLSTNFKNTVNIFDVAADNVTDETVTDKIAPMVVAGGIKTYSSNGTTLDYIVIEFEEAVKLNSFNKYSFTVEGRTVLSIVSTANASNPTSVTAENGKYVVIALDPTDDDAGDTTATPVVTLKNNVEDLNSGVLTVEAWADEDYETVDGITE